MNTTQRNRHGFNSKRVASRLKAAIEKREQELMDSRQSWDEWRFIERVRNNLFNQERG